MSDEREAKPVMSLERFLYEHSTRAEYLLREWQEKYAAPLAHYQPLLEAKDAEIEELRDALKKATKLESAERMASRLYRDENTNLKALLEQAREGLEHGLEAVKKYPEHPMTASEVIFRRVLFSINAATGEK